MNLMKLYKTFMEITIKIILKDIKENCVNEDYNNCKQEDSFF